MKLGISSTGGSPHVNLENVSFEITVLQSFKKLWLKRVQEVFSGSKLEISKFAAFVVKPVALEVHSSKQRFHSQLVPSSEDCFKN